MGIPITELAGLLKYGPIGFAVVLLVLGFIAAFKTLNKDQRSIVYTLLIIGVLCFLVSVGVQLYSLRLDNIERATLDAYKYNMNKETNFANSCRSSLGTISKDVDDATRQLTNLNQLTGDTAACPGGSGGIPIPHGRDMTALGTSIMSKLSDIKRAAATASE